MDADKSFGFMTMNSALRAVVPRRAALWMVIVLQLYECTTPIAARTSAHTCRHLSVHVHVYNIISHLHVHVEMLQAVFDEFYGEKWQDFHHIGQDYPRKRGEITRNLIKITCNAARPREPFTWDIAQLHKWQLPPSNQVNCHAICIPDQRLTPISTRLCLALEFCIRQLLVCELESTHMCYPHYSVWKW